MKLTMIDNGENPAPAKRLWPPNSIAHYRLAHGIKRPQLAKLVGLSREQIRKLEQRERRLDPDVAAKIGKAINVPWEDIGFSDAPDRYAWATRAISIVGDLCPGLEIKLKPPSKRIGLLVSVGTDTVALNIMPGTGFSVFEGMFMLFDNGNREEISEDILIRQIIGERFVTCLVDGTMWCRRIQPGSRKRRWHLSASNTEPILDVEIDWVSRMCGAQPGRQLPPVLPIDTNDPDSDQD